MSSVFPFFGDVETNEDAQQMPLYKEVKWDFENNKPFLLNGEFVFVTGNEAIKTWIYKALQVKRYENVIYSFDYGQELESIIGKGYSETLINSEATRLIKECLLINPYIKSIDNINITFENEGALYVDCDITTLYGNADVKGVRINVWKPNLWKN